MILIMKKEFTVLIICNIVEIYVVVVVVILL
jgi:hypothetical protein